VSWGFINANGEILAGSGDYTASRISGAYEIKWTKAKATSNYVVIATITRNNGGMATTSIAAATCKVFTFNVLGENIETQFSFIVVAAS
jgi:hypothetical protein